MASIAYLCIGGPNDGSWLEFDGSTKLVRFLVPVDVSTPEGNLHLPAVLSVAEECLYRLVPIGLGFDYKTYLWLPDLISPAMALKKLIDHYGA